MNPPIQIDNWGNISKAIAKLFEIPGNTSKYDFNNQANSDFEKNCFVVFCK